MKKITLPPEMVLSDDESVYSAATIDKSDAGNNRFNYVGKGPDGSIVFQILNTIIDLNVEDA